jgi:capsular polysaccharide biosynthesis protein
MNVPTASRLNRYFTVFLRWVLIAAVVFALTIFTGTYIRDNILRKVYTASAQIQIRAGSDMPLTAPLSPTPSPFQADIETMQSPDFLLPIITDLGLDKTWAKKINAADSDELPDVDALTHMSKILKLDVKRGTDIIEITASSDEPEEAADIANAIADNYKTLRDGEADHPLQESPVLILTRAEPPTEPSKPNKSFDFNVMIVGATLLSIVAASFTEVILMLTRASERTDN